MKKPAIQVGAIEQTISLIRGTKVIIDADLAKFYWVPTKRLNEQVKRYKDRFPADFMFQLTFEEKAEVVAKCDHLSNLKYSSTLPCAFTEHGALMVASVLNTSYAVGVSIFVVRAFVKLRQIILERKELAQKITFIERSIADHDEQINTLIKAIKQLLSQGPVPKKRRIGFQTDESQI